MSRTPADSHHPNWLMLHIPLQRIPRGQTHNTTVKRDVPLVHRHASVGHGYRTGRQPKRRLLSQNIPNLGHWWRIRQRTKIIKESNPRSYTLRFNTHPDFFRVVYFSLPLVPHTIPYGICIWCIWNLKIHHFTFPS